MAFGSGKFQCPGRSVRQLGSMDAESVQKASGARGNTPPRRFITEPQGNLGGHIWFVWSVVGWGVFVGMSVVASDRRPQETTLH